MSGDPQVQDLAPHAVHEEHRQLGILLQQIARTLRGRPVGRVDVVRHLEALESHLAAHFEHEERGGYFKEALAEAPRLRHRAAELLREHDQFRRSIARLCRCAHAAAEEDAWWDDVTEEFHELAGHLRQHEQGETELLHEAYGRDMGAND